MRKLMALIVAGLGLGAAGLAGAAEAAPSVVIKDAAARVVVIPEARSDIQVTVLRENARLPLRVERFGDRVNVIGNVARKVHGCRTMMGRTTVQIWGLGDVAYDGLPQIVIRAPLDVKLAAADAVYGAVGRTDSLEFANAGCGDWTIGNVKGAMRISQAGSGDTRTGTAGRAELRIAGSGDISTQAIRDGLTAVSAGSGDISAASVDGPFNAKIAGSGDVRVGGGSVTTLSAAIAGSGDVDFGGVAQSLDASVVGSGDVRAANVTGHVSKRLVGSGDVRIGR